ncbi:MAG: response regulator [Hyphomicrobiaceae bacterium]|nr:response regulator [Hyphomicrobiaceae bacterium]
MKFCLVADDSDVIRRIARRIIEGLGYIVVDADSEEAAFAICSKGVPQLILLDWRLPDGDTHTLVRKIRALKSEEPVHIIYCATEADPVDINDAFEAGISGYVLKPFDRESLFERILSCTNPLAAARV